MSWITLMCFTALVAIFFGMLLIAHEDGIPFNSYRKIRCFIGWHKRVIVGIRKYYCLFCGKGRKHPKLKVVDGGNKMRDNTFRG